jgi:hypothetical protein
MTRKEVRMDHLGGVGTLLIGLAALITAMTGLIKTLRKPVKRRRR